MVNASLQDNMKNMWQLMRVPWLFSACRNNENKQCNVQLHLFSYLCTYYTKTHKKVIFRYVRYVARKSGTDRISLSKTLVDLLHFYGYDCY